MRHAMRPACALSSRAVNCGPRPYFHSHLIHMAHGGVHGMWRQGQDKYARCARGPTGDWLPRSMVHAPTPALCSPQRSQEPLLLQAHMQCSYYLLTY
jgi:hypothetical protein